MDQAAILAKINGLRARHGVPPLHWDAAAAALAQSWAEQLSATGTFSHNPGAASRGWGENLWGISAGGMNGAAASAIDSWYSEIAQFNFSDPEHNDFNQTGHFTQLVWKNTTGVGFGAAVNAGGACVVVADFSPTGNYQGQYKDNVLPAGTTPGPVQVQDTLGNGYCLSQPGSTYKPQDAGVRIVGDRLTSADGKTYVIMQPDGNFVVYSNGSAIWHSHTFGSGPNCGAVMQNDGNLCVYNASNKWIWGSNTFLKGQKPFRLVMQNDGDLVLYDAKGTATWASKTDPTPQ
eukprot:TRINITY_DN1322_c0_g1_i4.p1 TRINITY_DN1322_c0_g1~~TRINITY_DN1322_c0_g1_i4.p1  ORF type:complete len:290 (-),score=67.06 TRINITY_DN1322_c0_g1_i4:405-1274(-)